MLILAAAENERIMIGNEIVIQVVGFGHCPQGRTARLGITAPREIEVDREVVRQQKELEGRRPRAR
jgi:carbon storage regulator CsrA